MMQLDRRAILGTVALLAMRGTAVAAATPAHPPGKPGEFDFLQGNWNVAHRWRQTTADNFIEFTGEARCWSILSGIASVEELRIPVRNFFGMGLRLLDREKSVWNDYWMNAQFGVLGSEGTPGYFLNGAGIFDAPGDEQGKPVIYRGIWDNIVPGVSHRWTSQISRDGGRSWHDLWLMRWARA